MIIWVDDIREPKEDGLHKYIWCKSTYDAINTITLLLRSGKDIELIDLDHDAGDYEKYGGDYIKILDWLEKHNLSYPLHIHSMNPVGIENMRRIIKKNSWKEII